MKVLIAVTMDKVSTCAAKWYFENLYQPGDIVHIFHLHTPPTVHINIGGKYEQIFANARYYYKEDELEAKMEAFQEDYKIPKGNFQGC